MLHLLEQFLIIFIIVFCLVRIYFFFRNKSKKYKKIPTMAMAYLIRVYKIDIYLLDINNVARDISIINAFIVAVDLLLYFYIKILALKIFLMFIATFVLIYICYSLLGKSYIKKLSR